MMKTLDWLNEEGGNVTFTLGDATTLFAHVEKFHPITDELREFADEYLPVKSVDLDSVRILSGDDIIESSDAVDESGFLMSLGYIVIGDHDNGVIVMNANDASVHVVDLDELELSRVECEEDTEEYFWNGEAIEDVSDDFEMAFEEASNAFDSFEEFDEKLCAALKGEIDREEIGI